MLRLGYVVSLCGFLLFNSAVQAVVLDDFEDGYFSLVSQPGEGASSTQRFLSTASVLAGMRIVNLDTIFVADPGPSSAEIVTTGGDDAVVFSAASGSGTLGTRLEVFYVF